MRKITAKNKASKDMYVECQNTKKNKQANKQANNHVDTAHICAQDAKCQNATMQKIAYKKRRHSGKKKH